MTVSLSGFLYDDSGGPISGANVAIFPTSAESGAGATISTSTDDATATTTTSSTGLWDETSLADNQYDVRITLSGGTSVRWLRHDSEAQYAQLSLISDTNAASNQVLTLGSANSTRADNDEVFVRFVMDNSAGEKTEFARMTAVATDVTDDQEDGQIEFDVMKSGTLTKAFTITSTDGAQSLDLNQDTITLGTASNTDISLNFDANTADGVLTWMEDEDYFKFSDDILMNSTERVYFRDTDIEIYSSTDGQLDLVANTEIQIAATTVDINGNVDVSGTYAGGGLMTTGGNIVIPNAGNIGSASDTDAIAIASGGVVTMNQIPVFSAGINVSGGTIAGTLATAAQTAITSVGTLTALQVDYFNLNASTLQITDSSDTGDLMSIAVATHGATTITTTDDDAAAADFTIDADGEVVIDPADAAGTIFKLNGTAQLAVIDGAILPATNNDIDLGSGSYEFKNAYFDGTVTSDAFAGPLTGDVTGTASKATVTDSTANTNFPVVFHNETDGLLDDTGALRYNPSTGQLLVPNLTVAGTTTTVDTVTMNAAHAVIFEGATADAHETTLSIVDPTGDHTQYLLNQGGYIPLLAAVTTTAITATPAELNVLDAVTAGTVAASLGVVVDSNKDIGTFRNITLSGELDAATLDVSGDADIDGTLEADAYTVAGVTLAEYISDTAGAMYSSNTETGIAATYQDGDNTIDLAVSAAQTTITSLLATDIKIGEDDQTKIDFEDANTINFYANNAKEVVLAENSISPGTSNGTALGTTSLQWSDLFLAEGGVINWDAGDFTMTQTGNVLAFAGGSTSHAGNITMGSGAHVVLATDSTLFFDGGVDTSIRESSANVLTFQLGNSDRLSYSAGTFDFQEGTTIKTTAGNLSLDAASQIRINDAGADRDTAIEGVGNASVVYVDASADGVCFGDSSFQGVGIVAWHAETGPFDSGSGMIDVHGRWVNTTVDVTGRSGNVVGVYHSGLVLEADSAVTIPVAVSMYLGAVPSATGGNVTISAAYTLWVAGLSRFDSGFIMGASDSANNMFDNGSNGTASTQMYIGDETIDTSAPSDIAFKDNVTDFAGSTDLLRELKIRTWNWNEMRASEGETGVGLVYQEVEPVAPHMTFKDSKGFGRINYKGFIPYLIGGWEDHDGKIEEQAETIAELNERIAALEAK